VSDLETSIERYLQELSKDPKSRSFVPLSDAYRQLGKYEEAIEVAQNGLKHYPTYISGKIALARAYYENGDLDPAFEILDRILTTTPDNLLANRIFADVCAHSGKADRAVKALEMVLKFEPNDERSKKLLENIRAPQVAKSGLTQTKTLANLYRSQGHHKEAKTVTENILNQMLLRIKERRKEL
jgi:tetratricopeptide (TPR) repeat protein